MKQLSSLFLIASSILLLTTCVYHDTVEPIDCTTSGLTITFDSVTAATSCSVPNGAIYVTATGNVTPLRFRVDSHYFESREITGLTTGIYTVYVIDGNGCEAQLSNVNVPADGLVFTPTFGEDTECFDDNGKITITVVEGKRPYVFNVDNGMFSDDSVFTGLSDGIHLVKARDVEGCEVDLQLSVPRGKTSVSWTTDIKPLFTVYCATTGCHNGISRTNDFRKIKSAQKFASDIKILTQLRKMPFEGSLTQQQIDMIACWVDDGAPEN